MTAVGLVTSLCEAASGQVCVGTENDGLCIYDPATGTFAQYLPEAKNILSIAGKLVKQIVRDGKGNIWLLAGSDQTQAMTLQRFDPESGQFRPYFEPFEPIGIFPHAVFHLYVNRKGFLWVLTGVVLESYDPYREVFADILQ